MSKRYTCITGTIVFMNDDAFIEKVDTIEIVKSSKKKEEFEEKSFHSGNDWVILEEFEGSVSFLNGCFND